MWKIRKAVEPLSEIDPNLDSVGGICFHDTYAYEGPTRRAVKSYDAKTQRFTVFPHKFCSVNCAKRFLNDHGFHHQSALMRFFSCRYYTVSSSIIPAPPRELLIPFLEKEKGGMSIQQFRRSFEQGTSMDITYPPFFMTPLVQLQRNVSTDPRNWVDRSTEADYTERKFYDKKKPIKEEREKRGKEVVSRRGLQKLFNKVNKKVPKSKNHAKWCTTDMSDEYIGFKNKFKEVEPDEKFLAEQ